MIGHKANVRGEQGNPPEQMGLITIWMRGGLLAKAFGIHYTELTHKGSKLLHSPEIDCSRLTCNSILAGDFFHEGRRNGRIQGKGKPIRRTKGVRETAAMLIRTDYRELLKKTRTLVYFATSV